MTKKNNKKMEKNMRWDKITKKNSKKKTTEKAHTMGLNNAKIIKRRSTPFLKPFLT